MPSVAVQAGTSGDNTLVAAVTNKKIQVVKAVLISSGTVNAKFKSGASTDLTGLFYLVANSGATLPGASYQHWFETAAGQALVLNLSAATAVGGVLVYELG